MCGVLCQDQWIPAIRPLWRPPKSGGWSITTLPPSLKDRETLAWAWGTRQQHWNADAASAVNEMVNLLQLNDILVTRELKAEIREHADREWCERDPGRCKRKPVPHDPLKTVAVHVRAPQASTGPTGGCCGGRR